MSHPNVHITALKPSEFEAGWFVLRLQEIAGKEVDNVSVTTPFRVAEAVFANTVESRSGDAANLSRLKMRPWQTVTILAKLSR